MHAHKPKNDSPIRANGDGGPVALSIALERMQVIARQTESQWASRRIQHCENLPDGTHQIGPNQTRLILLVQSFQALVFEAPNHLNTSSQCTLTSGTCQFLGRLFVNEQSRRLPGNRLLRGRSLLDGRHTTESARMNRMLGYASGTRVHESEVDRFRAAGRCCTSIGSGERQ